MAELFVELNDLLVKYRLKPNRKLSQHFLVNDTLIETMVSEAKLKEKDVVLEVGAGTGVVTKEIAKKCKVIAVEIDEKLCELLEKEISSPNVQVIQGDFLEMDFSKLKFNKAISSVPYSISTPFMHRLYELGFESAVLLFQGEFVERLLAEPGFFDYNALSVLNAYYCSSEKIKQNISPSSFYPKPSAFSSIVKLEYKKRFGSAKNDKQFNEFIKNIFRFKNKNLSNALQYSFPFIGKSLKINEKEFREKVSLLKGKEEKVSHMHCREFVQIFNQLVE